MFINIASNGRVAIQNKMRAEIANSSGFFVGKKNDTDIILYHACIPYYRKQNHKIKEKEKEKELTLLDFASFLSYDLPSRGCPDRFCCSATAPIQAKPEKLANKSKKLRYLMNYRILNNKQLCFLKASLSYK